MNFICSLSHHPENYSYRRSVRWVGDLMVLCIFASLGFHSRSFRGVTRTARKNFIHHQQAASKVNSFSVNYTAKLGAVLMIHTVMKKFFQSFFISPLRFAAGSRLKKLLKFKFSASFHGLRNFYVGRCFFDHVFQILQTFSVYLVGKTIKIMLKVVCCGNCHRVFGKHEKRSRFHFCVNRHMNKGRSSRSPFFIVWSGAEIRLQPSSALATWSLQWSWTCCEKNDLKVRLFFQFCFLYLR